MSLIESQILNQTNPNIIVSHPTGNANVRAALDGFNEQHLLSAFYTSIATQEQSFFKLISKFPGLSEFKRRAFNEELSPLIHPNPWLELMRLFCMKANIQSLIRHEHGIFSIDAVYRDLDRQVARAIQSGSHLDAIYAYEDAALHSFEIGHARGVKCYYDLPIGYWKAARVLMSEEIEKRPEWAATLSGFNDSQAKIDRKDQELALADHIFVASSFTANSLKHYHGQLSEISVIPYGFPQTGVLKSYVRKENQKLKLLFVGGLSQRKGIADVFDAIETLKDKVELTVVGRRPNADVPILDKCLSSCIYLPSLPHHEILSLMKNSDVLIFPSLFEGFGLVITEAMSQGTPVITTNRTAGPDLITHNENGWIVEAGNPTDLKNRIETLLANPDLIEKNGRAAHQLASSRPWGKCGFELAQKVKSLFN